MEEVKKLIAELKKEEYSKYDLDFHYYIPPIAEKYKSYLDFNDNQKKIFKLVPSESQERPYRLTMALCVEKLFSIISEEDFEKAIKLFSDAIDSVVEVHISASIDLPIEKYVTIPALPTAFEKGDEQFGTPLLTGVKISFENAKKDLKGVSLNTITCLSCGEIGLRVSMVLKKECRFLSEEIISTLLKIEEYSKYFYKIRDAK